jgi:hypothetical protein
MNVMPDWTTAIAINSAAKTRPRNVSGTAIWSRTLLETQRIDPNVCASTTTAAANQTVGANPSSA